MGQFDSPGLEPTSLTRKTRVEKRGKRNKNICCVAIWIPKKKKKTYVKGDEVERFQLQMTVVTEKTGKALLFLHSSHFSSAVTKLFQVSLFFLHTHRNRRRARRCVRRPAAVCPPPGVSCRRTSAWRGGICWKCLAQLQRHPMTGTPAGRGSGASPRTPDLCWAGRRWGRTWCRGPGMS